LIGNLPIDGLLLVAKRRLLIFDGLFRELHLPARRSRISVNRIVCSESFTASLLESLLPPLPTPTHAAASGRNWFGHVHQILAKIRVLRSLIFASSRL
jgi:hypothetical protein